MYILVLGNPIDGFKFEGPFATGSEAIEYGEGRYPQIEWWTVLLMPPGDEVEQPIAPIMGQNLYCSCGHLWSEHTQNVHRTYVCSKCQCRGMNPPSENPN
jgi:hypothetical protein